RSKSSDQSQFKTHRPCHQIAREHTPGTLLTLQISSACDFVDHNSKLTPSLDHFFHDLGRNGNRRRSTKRTSLTVSGVRPTTQKRVPLALNRNRVKPALEPNINICLETTTFEGFTNCERSFLCTLHQLPVSQRHGRDI